MFSAFVSWLEYSEQHRNRKCALPQLNSFVAAAAHMRPLLWRNRRWPDFWSSHSGRRAYPLESRKFPQKHIGLDININIYICLWEVNLDQERTLSHHAARGHVITSWRKRKNHWIVYNRLFKTNRRTPKSANVNVTFQYSGVCDDKCPLTGFISQRLF